MYHSADAVNLMDGLFILVLHELLMLILDPVL